MWGVWDVNALMDAMTPEQLDLWIAKHRISPIGMSGVVELVANILTILASSEEQKWTPHEVKQACVVLGQHWNPIKPPAPEPMTAEQAAMLIDMATRR